MALSKLGTHRSVEVCYMLSLLVTWKEIQPNGRQQTPTVQIHNYTYMDIWH
jgi:hypothetical protein